MSVGSKSRVLSLLRILHEETDYKHSLNTQELIARLEEQGFNVNRKTLKDDIENIKCFCPGVVIVKSSPNRFYYGERLFSVDEVKCIIDSACTAGDTAEADELVQKLKSLHSRYDSREITAYYESKKIG